MTKENQTNSLMVLTFIMSKLSYKLSRVPIRLTTCYEPRESKAPACKAMHKEIRKDFFQNLVVDPAPYSICENDTQNSQIKKIF